MRSDQNAQPQNQNADFNSGINMLPGYNPGERSNEWEQSVQQGIEPQTIQGRPLPEPSFTQTPSAVPIPRAVQVNPALQSVGGWNIDPSGNLLNSPSTPSAGNWNIDQSGNLNDPGWFHKLLSLIGGVPSGLESIFNQHQVPQQRAPGITGRPSFGLSIFQNQFPGSRIGPTSGAITNPYTPGTVLGGRQPLGGPAPGYATAFSNTVKARNII